MSDPLRLYEVLEEEYERLQGRRAPQTVAEADNAEERLKRIIKENHKQELAALCLSGGGIRSATFGLGVIQGLAHNKLLSKFSYLSTVSGGGYVGSWLSAWIRRHPLGAAGVEAELPSEHPQYLLKPEPEPITHLRSYSNYLTPKLGLLSADTWTLIAIVVRNLLVNWLVLIPLLLAVLALPRLFVSFSQWRAPAAMRVGALALGFVFGVMMVVYVAISRPSITDRHVNQKQFLRRCWLPLVISASLLTLYWAWTSNAANHDLEKALTAHLFDQWHPAFRFLLFGVALHLIAWVIYTPILWWRQVRLHVGPELAAMAVNGLVGGLLLYLVTSRVFAHPAIKFMHGNQGWEVSELLLYASFAVPLYLVLVFLAITFFTGIASQKTEDEDREWWARCSGWILITVVIWSAASLLVLVGPPLTGYLIAQFVLPAGGIIGIVTALVAHSAKVPAKEQQDAKGLNGLLHRYALPLGTLIFAAFLVVALSIGTNFLIELLATPLRWLLPKLSMSIDWLHNQTAGIAGTEKSVAHVVIFPSAREIFIFIGLTAGFGSLMAKYINTNKFSYHAMYRNRLIRAYLGASRRSSDRHPDPFTGFDPSDNLSMCELRPQLLHSGSFHDAKGKTTFADFILRIAGKEDAAAKRIARNVLSPETRKLLSRSAKMVQSSRSINPDDDSSKPDHTLTLLENALLKDINKALLKPRPILTPPAGTKPPSTNEGWLSFNRQQLQAAFDGLIQPVPTSWRRPLHVINMTLNLVHGESLAWQQRKAESFTVTPLHSGSFQIPETDRTRPVYGYYRRTNQYAGDGGISIGTALAISGAAVSPNMGYYSSPLVTFLMTIFNVRLGWWLGNPGPAGEDHYRLAYPKFAVYPIIAEALGLTDDRNSYVYLSDGGHFENLGLYEMVLRRCRLIVVSDASDDADFQFDNLGNAVKKVRIDFGIPIEFKSVGILPRKEKKKGAFCAVGTIRYSAVDEVDKIGQDKKPVLDEAGRKVQVPAPDGIIVYIKPIFYGDEPRDVYHYAMTHETFPHESTMNQWFSESQFESYRKLGSYVVDTLCNYQSDGSSTGLGDVDLSKFIDLARKASTVEKQDGARSEFAALAEDLIARFKGSK